MFRDTVQFLLALVALLLIGVIVAGGWILLRGNRAAVEPAAAAVALSAAVTDAPPTAVAPTTAPATAPATPLPAAPPTNTPLPTAAATATPLPTATSIPPTVTPTPLPSSTPVPVVIVPPTATPVPPTATPSVCAYAEANGFVIVDVESTAPVDLWTFENSAPGYTGSGYYTWRGDNHYNDPAYAILVYRVLINNPGVYQFRLHNYHDHPDGSESNDAWVQIPGVQPWIKTWSGDRVIWNWFNNFEVSKDNHRAPEVNFGAPGVYEVHIAARSNGFSIDRFALTTDAAFWTATSLSQPQSPCQPLP